MNANEPVFDLYDNNDDDDELTWMNVVKLPMTMSTC